MQDLFPETEIRDDQAEAIARGLFAVARADGGIHEREAALIADFFAGVSTHSADLAGLERSPKIEGANLAAILATPELRQVFLKTAMLLAYADGNYSAAESKVIGEYAAALGQSDADLRKMETQVKEYMLNQLSHLSNTDAVAEVARELKI